MKKFSFILFALFSLFVGAQAQEVIAQEVSVQTARPKIMVIPYTSEGQDIRTVLENDVYKRIALTKIKEAFDQRGYTTVDFFAKLKNVAKANALGASQQQDVKTMIIQQSGADVYIEAETSLLESGTGNAMKVILSGYEVSTANSLANAVCESGKFYTDDYGRLTSRAIEKSIDGFLNTMQMKLADMIDNGQSISVTIGIDEASSCSMTMEVGSEGLMLSDALELWVEEHAYKGNYHIQGTTDKQILFDDIRIPLKDDNGRTYNANKFSLALLQFFRSNGLKIERTISNNMLVITIK